MKNPLIYSVIAFALVLTVLIFAVAVSAETLSGIHVLSIDINCDSNGNIIGSAIIANHDPVDWSGDIKFYLTYHLPGGGDWIPSGDEAIVSVTVPAQSQITVNFSMECNVPPEANSVRVENNLDTTKSPSIPPCGQQPTPTPTDTPVTPTDTPTPTTVPSPTPTNTQGPSPTPTSSATVGPSPTLTQTPTATNTVGPSPTPTKTVTVVPSLTPTVDPSPVATRTPQPPQPAQAMDISDYPRNTIGILNINGQLFNIYRGADFDNDAVLDLPAAGGSYYLGTIYMHRIQENATGWLEINAGEFISFVRGNRTYKYRVSGYEYLQYGIYPTETDGLTYIASCFSDRNGNWAGIELYRLQLIRLFTHHVYQWE